MTFRFTAALVLAGATALVANAAESRVTPLERRARAVLAEALVAEKAFVKVHAAEALIALGEKADARRVFRAELPAANTVSPYRIGVWRVLASASETPEERAQWIARTEAVLLDDSASDRLHAIESLGKLGHAPIGPVRAAAEAMAKGSAADAVFPHWVLHLAGDKSALPAIVAALDSDDPIARLRAAYVLRWLHVDDPATRAAIARTAEREPSTSKGHAIILGAAVTLEADPARTPAWITALEQILANGAPGARYDACQTLMGRYPVADLTRFTPLLDHPDGDARIGAAWAILHVSARGAK